MGGISWLEGRGWGSVTGNVGFPSPRPPRQAREGYPAARVIGRARLYRLCSGGWEGMRMGAGQLLRGAT